MVKRNRLWATIISGVASLTIATAGLSVLRDSPGSPIEATASEPRVAESTPPSTLPELHVADEPLLVDYIKCDDNLEYKAYEQTTFASELIDKSNIDISLTESATDRIRLILAAKSYGLADDVRAKMRLEEESVKPTEGHEPLTTIPNARVTGYIDDRPILSAELIAGFGGWTLDTMQVCVPKGK